MGAGHGHHPLCPATLVAGVDRVVPLRSPVTASAVQRVLVLEWQVAYQVADTEFAGCTGFSGRPTATGAGVTRRPAGSHFRPCMSVKGNSTDTTSPTLNAVVDRIVRGVVLEELFDGQSLPVDFFRSAANEMRQVPIQPKLISEG